MFESNINLLSPHKKSRLKKIVQFLFVKEMLEFCIFTCILLSITHILGGLILSQALNDLATSSLLINRDFPGINDDIRRVNKLTKGVVESSAAHSALSPKLVELIQTIPNDIRLDAITLNRDTLTLTLAGTAKTRDALLNFPKVLSAIPWMNQVLTPVSQLLQKDNISFEIKTTVKNIPRQTVRTTAPQLPRKTLEE